MKLLATIMVIVALLGLTSPVQAVEQEQTAAAQLMVHEPELDTRVDRLQAYLEAYHSPLASYADTFVREADRHNLDWKLVAAIAGVESTFGKHIPAQSYNAWGWGIPTGAQSGIAFSNWERGIATVSEGLASRYYKNQAKSIYDVGWVYAANGISWGNHVTHFLEEIEAFLPKNAKSLDVTI